MHRFCHFELRTTDVHRAKDFYRALLGEHGLALSELPEQARVRGAVPHWLGQLGVDDAERSAAAFVERGAQRLGPPRISSTGATVITLRDPAGAVIALASPAPESASSRVAFHLLNAADDTRAASTYRDLLQWDLQTNIELATSVPAQLFSFARGEPIVGAIAPIAGRPGVHPHWLFFFSVDDVQVAIAEARDRGAVCLGVSELSNAARVAVCDDPQGAAFGLIEGRPFQG